jgi:hypothetical protein
MLNKDSEATLLGGGSNDKVFDIENFLHLSW